MTEIGLSFASNPTETKLADIFHSRFKLFGEVLKVLECGPATVQAVDSAICASYGLDWKNCTNTRKRMDWLETFNLIEGLADHKWQLTKEGAAALQRWELVTPEIVESFESQVDEVRIERAPEEIENTLQALRDDPSLQVQRSKFGIWCPSPNRIDNLRTIATFAFDKIPRLDLFALIEDRFNLKRSSVDAMMPFLKAADLIIEVSRGVYATSPEARAWCETGSDLDFVRLLHGNVRFVGEMIDLARRDIARNELYEIAKGFGVNKDNVRAIASFLLEAGLLEEPRYLHLKATQLGLQLLSELPLASVADFGAGEAAQGVQDDGAVGKRTESNEMELMFARLHDAARDPFAENDKSGAAFEKIIAQVFSYIGFEVKRIGGSGDTDVLVSWKDSDGNVFRATADGKSKSSGVVTHGDISDVALEAHREKHGASFTAIVGAGFGGETIRNHAKKRGYVLITDEELAQIARAAHELGFDLEESALIFQSPDGKSQFEELASRHQRQLELTSLVVATYIKEQSTYGSLSARDLSLLLRNSELAPSIEELIPVLELLSTPVVRLLSISDNNRADEHVGYLLSNERTAANRLVALARAIDKGVIEGTS